MKEQSKKMLGIQGIAIFFVFLYICFINGGFAEIIPYFKHGMFERHVFVFLKYILHDKSYPFAKYLVLSMYVFRWYVW